MGDVRVAFYECYKVAPSHGADKLLAKEYTYNGIAGYEVSRVVYDEHSSEDYKWIFDKRLFYHSLYDIAQAYKSKNYETGEEIL